MNARNINLLKINRMRTVPYFVSEVFREGQRLHQQNDENNGIDDAGRGNRTPMELPPTDFEFPKNTVSL